MLPIECVYLHSKVYPSCICELFSECENPFLANTLLSLHSCVQFIHIRLILLGTYMSLYLGLSILCKMTGTFIVLLEQNAKRFRKHQQASQVVIIC